MRTRFLRSSTVSERLELLDILNYGVALVNAGLQRR